MRLYLRKLLAICGLLGLLWFIVSFTSMIEVPRTAVKSKFRNIEDYEIRVNNLEKQMDKQLTDSNKLLQKMVNHLRNKEEKVGYQEARLRDELQKIRGEIGTVLPVLVIACDRITVKRCLDNLIKFRPDKETFPIIVSQDCGHNATYRTIKAFTDVDPSITLVKQPDLSDIPLEKSKVKFKGYYKIARHFKFALSHVLETLGHEAVIIVEDDLDISPDFYEYFLGTYPLLHKDPTIWCISAWNDNGKKELVDQSRPELLHRTDFFPGLGWMLRRENWLELKPHWPEAFFDDWLRNPANTKGRACIRPEISRTYSFGKLGVSKGLFFDVHLRYMQLNTDYVEFTKHNLTYLLRDNYDAWFSSLVGSLPSAAAEEAAAGGAGALRSDVTAVRVPYSNAKNFQRAAKRLGLMDDFRSGIPRTAYRGVVQCHIKGRRVYLAPNFDWEGYDPSWG